MFGKGRNLEAIGQKLCLSHSIQADQMSSAFVGSVDNGIMVPIRATGGTCSTVSE